MFTRECGAKLPVVFTERCRGIGSCFLATLWALAYVEELFWHRGVWHERQWLFGGDWDWTRDMRTFIAPLLALPQLTHYVLDGFVWRRKNNPDFRLI